MVGNTISHYRILEKLGEGGMGVVYKAEDTNLRRTVALKFLTALRAQDDQERKRFQNEARAAARLNHPNIATIFEFGEVREPQAEAPGTFIAMELVEGLTLRHVIQRGPHPGQHITSILLQIARGLQEAHHKGVVHRDLKPSNVIVRPDGTIKILDFGIAHLLGETSTSHDESIAGSVPYMSPEQIRGEGADSRSDLWSFGVIAFELLTRTLPFRGDHPPALMYSITNESPQNTRELRTDVSETLHVIIDRCLQKDPNLRPQSADDIIALLEQASEIPVAPAERRRFSGGRTWVALGVVIAIAVITWFVLFRPQTADMVPVHRWTVGVLPYAVPPSKPEITDWPLLIQALMSNELTGIGQLAVYDPLSLNTRFSLLPDGGGTVPSEHWYTLMQDNNLTYGIRGIVFPSSHGYSIQTNLLRIPTRELVYSSHTEISGEGDLPAAIRASAEKIMGYFESLLLSEGREKDLRPWHASRVRDVEATKAFLQASQLVFKGMPGVEEYLNRAIRLDSSFVGARVWLISRLEKAGDHTSAESHYRVLQRLEPDASGFDQQMIRWTGAFLKGNLTEQERYLELALGYSPGNNILLANLAYTRYEQRDYSGALAALEQPLASHWSYSPIYPLAGRCYVHLKQYDKAWELLRSALDISPVHPILLSTLAALAHSRNDTVAAKHYEDMLFSPMGTDPTHLARAHQMIAEDLVEVGLRNLAVDHMEQSLMLDSTSAEAKAVRLKLSALHP